MTRTLIFLATGLLAGAAIAADVNVIWPLDLPTRYLTSNFMEYRPGRYHAGLDLKTQTVSGFPTRAVEDGWLVRVRATPYAYGRAIYLRGNSGRTYVYAHLSRFNDTLREAVAAQRARTGTYRARMEFAPGQIPVRQGDVLGLTGQSGTGGPHLHFEVRDGDNRPIDPQAVGFATADTIAPTIMRIRAWPVTPDTRLNGSPGEHVLSAAAGLRGVLPPLQVTGIVAFSARVVERSDIRGHSLESSRLEMWLDGKRVYRGANEGFAFGESSTSRQEWTVLAGQPERWLHRNPAVALAGREGTAWYLGESGQGLTAGRHVLELEAVDQADNRTSATFELIVGSAAGPGTSPARTGWRQESVSPRLVGRDSLSFIELSPFFEVNNKDVWADRPDLRRYRFTPEAGDPVLVPMVVYSDCASLETEQVEAARGQGLVPLGPVREFVAADWPVEASLPVMIETPDRAASDTWGLYRWGTATWQWVDPWPTSQAGETSVGIDGSGVYAIMDDTESPRIEEFAIAVVVGPGPESTVAGVTMPAWSVLAVGIQDPGSGVAPGTIEVTLDGHPLIVEPDLPRERILIEFPAEMPAGDHNLGITVSDRVGLTSNRELDIRAVR